MLTIVPIFSITIGGFDELAMNVMSGFYLSMGMIKLILDSHTLSHIVIRNRGLGFGVGIEVRTPI